YNDDKQLLHIGTLENTSLVDEKNHVIQSHKEYIVRGVQTDKAGNLWLGTTLGLIRKNLHTGEEKIIDAKESSITDILVEKSQDKIWYVTPPALKSYDSKTGVIEKFPYDNGFNNSDMAFNMSLYSTLAFHPDSTIWVRSEEHTSELQSRE